MWRVKSLDAILATAKKKSLHRSLGPIQLTLLGVGAIIGTGIFVLTAAAAQKAGPGMMLSFVIAGAVCAFAALCYSELASMVPVSGSAYTYTYAVMGELLAWMVGWALILEYARGGQRRIGRLVGLLPRHDRARPALPHGPMPYDRSAWSLNGFVPAATSATASSTSRLSWWPSP
jgi:APA family basic amino acid/polyamine antiporter